MPDAPCPGGRRSGFGRRRMFGPVSPAVPGLNPFSGWLVRTPCTRLAPARSVWSGTGGLWLTAAATLPYAVCLCILCCAVLCLLQLLVAAACCCLILFSVGTVRCGVARSMQVCTRDARTSYASGLRGWSGYHSIKTCRKGRSEPRRYSTQTQPATRHL